jgi:hypothetical protein
MSANSGAQTSRLDSFLSRAVAFLAIIAIPAGLFGYFSSHHVKRVETAFELYKAFKSSPTQDHWMLLMRRWNEKAAEADALLGANDQQGLLRLTRSIVSDEQGLAAFEGIASFFDGLSACVDSNLCDRNTAAAMLKHSAHEFVGAFGSYIIDVRQTHKNSTYCSGLFKINALEKRFNLFEWL